MHCLWQSRLEEGPQTHWEMPFGEGLRYWGIWFIMGDMGHLMLLPQTHSFMELENHGQVTALACRVGRLVAHSLLLTIHVVFDMASFWLVWHFGHSMARGLSLVNGVGAVLGWAKLGGCLWCGYCYLALSDFLHGGVARPRDSASPWSGRVFLGS